MTGPMPTKDESRPMRVAFYESGRDPAAASLEVDWAELAGVLTDFLPERCDVSTCQGKKCPEKDVAAWSPVDLSEPYRLNDNVEAVTLFVGDLDHVPPGAIDGILQKLDGYAYALHTTHSHAEGDGAYRVVVPLTEPIPAARWPAARRAIVEALDLPVDPSCKDLSRFYYLPTRRAGAPHFSSIVRGAWLDTSDVLAAADVLAPPARVLKASDVPPTPPAPVDLAELRAKLTRVRRSKSQRDDERSKEQAALLGRVLKGEPIGEPGALHQARVRICGMLAYHVPANTPWEAVHEILRASLAATPVADGDTLELATEKTRELYAASMAERVVKDAEAAAERERVRAAVKAMANRSVPASVKEVVEAGGDWQDLIILNEKTGEPRPCEYNCALYLTCDPDLQAPDGRPAIRWNDVLKRIEVVGGPFEGTQQDTLPQTIAGWLQRQRGLFAGAQMVAAAIKQVAFAASFDPLRDEISAAAWDGVPRLETALTRYFAAEDTPYTRAVSKRWFVALVARALEPGCKMDSVLVLEGKEGWRKSSALAALVGRQYFSDTKLKIGDTSAMHAVASRWVMEMSDLAGMRSAETETLTGFISSPEDFFRLPYGAVMVAFPRRCVLVGSTNDAEYLKKRTGNRRWWPVRCVGRLDVPGIRRDRLQLLAEAAAVYHAASTCHDCLEVPGERCSEHRWWFEGDETKLAAVEAAQRLETSPVEQAVSRWWFGEQPQRRPKTATMLEVAEAIGLTADRVDHKARTEIGAAMIALGFSYVPRRAGGGRRERVDEPTPELLSAPVEVQGGRRQADLALVSSVKAIIAERSAT